MKRKELLALTGAAAVGGTFAPSRARAASLPPFKIGIIWSYTGAGPTPGPELDGAIAAFQKVHGTTAGGRQVTFVRRDDTGVAPETARRMAQELIVQEKVDCIAGLIFTANANTVGDISNQSKTPVFLVNSVATGLLPRFPYMVRFSFTTLEITDVLGKWAAKNGIKSVYSIYHDNQSGVDANTGFGRAFEGGGGKIVGVSPVPLTTGDFSPYIQRVHDAKPDAVFIFLLASGGSAQMLKQLEAAGIQKAGIKILSTGDLVSEDNLPQMGDPAMGIVSSFHYSAWHSSALNRTYQAAGMDVTRGNPVVSFAGCAMWDILTAVYKYLDTHGGEWSTDAVMSYLSTYKAESPRGPIAIDPATRDIVQNVYLRTVEKRNGQLGNAEFATIPLVHSPEK